LHLRWQGFRKVRRQVCKRIDNRRQELGLPDVAAYRAHLEAQPQEWAQLDQLCWINISRFYRDRMVFQQLERCILPDLAEQVTARADSEIRCWNAGCAAGEEPYTLAIIWRHCCATQFPALRLRVVATDIDPVAVRRAERGCYRPSSVKELPSEWRTQAFVAIADELCLKPEYRNCVTFMLQDIRRGAPAGIFDLILCRNLVFTYFDAAIQQKILRGFSDSLAPGGALIIGNLETLPDGPWGLVPWFTRERVYRKTAKSQVD
jgi:chemotaxis protein methyltransferase CheR